MLQAEVPQGQVLQAALLRHRLLKLPGHLLLSDGVLGPRDMLRSGPDVLHGSGELLLRSRRDLLLGFGPVVLRHAGFHLLRRSGPDLLHSGGHLLCAGPDVLHGPGELLRRSRCLVALN